MRIKKIKKDTLDLIKCVIEYILVTVILGGLGGIVMFYILLIGVLR
ncbi:MAG: hypothetical protein K2N36_08170 [Ruminiclostridium sp.]|nr:hypothetical protein [Ruminiclostridium sp.]